MSHQYYIGMISGTSMDAIDCALVDFADQQIRTVDFINIDIPDAIKQNLLTLCMTGQGSLQLMGETDIAMGRLFAEAVMTILQKNQLEAKQIRAIGSHGQTIWHQPPGTDTDDKPAYTVQIGNPNTIVARTGITTVADFRGKDMAYGGQGAPMVPAFHREVFQSHENDRVILNTGGIANITLLGRQGNILGFDTGPANVLMDCWINQCQQLDYDSDGQWAATAAYDPGLLKHFLDEEYFRLPYPKSTGRELFNASWLQDKLNTFEASLADAVIQSTLLELTTVSISQAITGLVQSGEVVVCGGGAHNQRLLERLAFHLDGFSVFPSDSLGLSCDSIEACAFAWFGKMALQRQPVDMSSITGSSRGTICGGIYYSEQ